MKFPSVVIYTDRFIGKDSSGRAIYFVILIRPSKRDDKGLLVHELEHVKQGWLGLFLPHAYLYFLSKTYRSWCEVRAYQAQLRYYKSEGDTRDHTEAFAKVLASGYKLNITEAEALRRLRKGL